MTPTEFVDGLADIMNVERTELATVDRSLAKSGHRRLARGRARPDIDLLEGLLLVCSWASATNRTMADAEVERLKRFSLLIEEGAAIKQDVENLCGSTVEELSGCDFLRVLSMIARQLGAGRFPAHKVRVALEKGGQVDIGFLREPSWAGLRFVELGKKHMFQKRQNVSITVTIRGPVLKWIYEATEGQ